MASEKQRGCFKNALCGLFSNKRPQRCFMLLAGLGLAALTVISSVKPDLLGFTDTTGELMQYVFGSGSAAAFTGWGAMKISDRIYQCKKGRANKKTTAKYITKDILAAGLLIAAVCLFMACGAADMATVPSGIPLSVGLSGIFVFGGLFLNMLGSRTDKKTVYVPDDELRAGFVQLVEEFKDHVKKEKQEKKAEEEALKKNENDKKCESLQGQTIWTEPATENQEDGLKERSPVKSSNYFSLAESSGIPSHNSIGGAGNNSIKTTVDTVESLNIRTAQNASQNALVEDHITTKSREQILFDAIDSDDSDAGNKKASPDPAAKKVNKVFQPPSPRASQASIPAPDLHEIGQLLSSEAGNTKRLRRRLAKLLAA